MPISGPPLENYWWERPPPAHRHQKNKPSFSASLLDAITRSLDDSDSAGGGGEPHRRRRLTGGAPDPIPPVTATAASSSSSSFFSSDTDTPVRIRPIRTGPILTRSDRIRVEPPQNQAQTKALNQDLTSIKKKLRDLRRSAGPVSPGARLAGFLSSLFHPHAANPKKPKIAAAAAKEQSPSLCSRSCLSKTPSTRGGKRSVRFSTVDVVVGGGGGGGGGGGRRDFPVREVVRGFVVEEEDYESDSSEDLFELENLGGIASKNNGKSFRDELPVYGTTSLGINRAIARGLVV